MTDFIASTQHSLGIVVIGRDEELRLEACLRSALAAIGGRAAAQVLYVDSGSNDRSREIAAGIPGVSTIALGPGNAAIARNAGWRSLASDQILFLDGDMVLQPGFLPAAEAALDGSEVAAVTGFIVEEQEGTSLATRVFGQDWSRRVGEVPAVGGAALWWRADLEAVGGFDAGLVVGEDPDLSLRVRARGRRLLQIETPMVEHRLGLRGWLDWWRRGVSVGLSSALIASRYRDAAIPRDRLRRARRDVALAAFVIVVAGLTAAAGAMTFALSWLVVLGLGFAAKIGGVISRDRRKAERFGAALAHALHGQCIKLPLLVGAHTARRHLDSPRRQS